jgi:DNA-binding transcriptional LysR family regulator
MHYTLHQLKVFLTVTETGSITKAAEELHLTQPAVSIQLKNFQDQFDIPLIELIGRKLYVTDFGKEVAESAGQIIREVETINDKGTAHHGELTGKLKISIVSTGQYIMPHFLSSFIKEHPNVNLVMDVTNKSKVVESLEKNQVDFSLVSLIPESLNVDRIELMENHLFLVGNTQEAQQYSSFQKKDWRKIPLIFREKGSGTRQTIENFFTKNKIDYKQTLTLTSNEAVKQAVIAGLGFSIMPIIGIRDELLNGTLKIIPIKGFPITSEWSLVWLKNKKFSPVARTYLEELKKNKEEIMKTKFNWIEENEPA